MTTIMTWKCLSLLDIRLSWGMRARNSADRGWRVTRGNDDCGVAAAVELALGDASLVSGV